VLLGSADYTASNGLSVVLVNGCTVGDLVEVISFQVSSVLNAIPATAGSVGTTFLADNSVTTAKIAPGAVVQADLATGVAGTGPAFSAYATTAQTLASNVFTKILFDTERFDTNNNFASSRFTPTVAGYYFISASVGVGATTTGANMTLFKNGVEYQEMLALAGNVNAVCGNTPLVFCNGTTDYLEIFVRFVTGQNTFGNLVYTYFSGAMVRAA
jgi:hypothetical protein